MNKLLLIACLTPFIFLGACVSNKAFKQALYFNDSITEAEKQVAYNPIIIKPGDRLNISITAINKDAAEAFNMTGAGAQTGAANGGYFVDSSGSIQLLQLGDIHVAGLTAIKLQDSLASVLLNYLKGPIVIVSISNFKINMMGEIGTPGSIAVPDGNINILQAITRAGDLKSDARRDNILVIRETDGKRQFGRVDISSNHVFESPYFYLKQDDIVYVEPDRKKYQTNDAQTNRIFRNYGYATTILTTVLLLVNLFKK